MRCISQERKRLVLVERKTTGGDALSRTLNRLAAKIYAFFAYPKRLTYKSSFKKITSPFKAHAYLEKWFKYRANEHHKYNCLLPEEVWSEDMLDENGKHWDDCDGYAAAVIDQIKAAGYKCYFLCFFTYKGGHATLVIETKNQMKTLGTFGLWCHGNRDTSLSEIAQDFYPGERIRTLYVSDRNWKVTHYGQRVNNEFVIVEVP